ncbi:MAG: [protein-PII] uridylyltransferase [Actinomycetota bacterium]|nr:[protein-PII] uridylyltransferase [Actinomycetota bacterium]
MAARVPPELAAVRHDPSLTGTAYCRALSDATDRWLARLFVTAAGEPEPRGLALVAVGGYGRAELCPSSDVDVMLVYNGRGVDRARLAALAEAIWYPVWDAGVKLGHAVRSGKEALALASDDLDTATALLDVRLLAGDASVARALAEKAAGQWRARSSRWLDELGRSVAQRHERAGEVAFLLEPDLKEGRGGLRDAHALRWAEAASRILLEEDHAALAAAYEVLLAARVELQRRTGKPSDTLLLQEQDAVAAALGQTDADALMGRIAAAARTIAWTSDETWQRIAASLEGPSGRLAGADQPVGAGLVLRDGLVELAPGVEPAADPTLVVRAAAAAAANGTRLGRVTLDRLAREGAVPSEPWPDEARRALLRLLGAGRDAIPVLEALDQKGLLVRLVPEWEKVRSLPQRNAYHRFTVDRHLCEAAAEAAGLAARVHRPDLLLLGAWLHDIGKGFEGDHTDAGIPVAERIATRMGFPSADVRVLGTMVRHHLLLPDAATRRDVQDPATVATVAEAVGDRRTLELLHALTEADSIATGPAAWSPWKSGLLTDLVSRTAKVLEGEELPDAQDDFPTPEQRALIEQVQARGEVVVEGRGRTLSLAAPDRPGLFARVAGTLALHGLDVLSARVWSSEADTAIGQAGGVAVESFRVEPVFGGEPDWAEVEADLRKVLAGRMSLEARLAERSRTYGARSRLRSATPAQTAVAVDNEASASASVVEVRAPDRIGTLYRITRALADLELDIRHATVATLGHELVDTFYVVDVSGAKLDREHARAVEQAILVELTRV